MLAQLEASLLEEIGRAKDAIAVERSPDEADARLGTVARDAETVKLLRASHRLKEIRQARRRVTDGTYGACESCGEPIPRKRLEAIPWAAYCITCQEMRDQEFAATEVTGAPQPRPQNTSIG